MNKIIKIIIIIILILIIILYYINKNIFFQENFSSTWDKSISKTNEEKAGLTDNQKNEVKKISQQISKSELVNLITAQSPLLTGPMGPQGVQGPAGTSLIASGRLANKGVSFEKTNKSKINPDFVVTRTEGTNPSASLAFVDKIQPFASYQDWQLDINNNLKNRFDGTCVTMSTSDDSIYMDKCDPNNSNQKWNWDNTNRLISTSNSTPSKLKCISIRNEENNHITSVPGCVGKKCLKTGKYNFLITKDCIPNNVVDNEVWAFV